MVRLIVFDWVEFLRLAEELAARPDDEAATRTAISRAYYAILGRASLLLQRQGATVPVMKRHGYVWRAFKNSQDPRRVTVGMDIDLLRQLRDRADYDDRFRADEAAMSADVIRRARSVVATLDLFQQEQGL